MCAKILSIIGIILVLIGTILSIWTIMSANTNFVGTYDELANRHKDFLKEQNLVKVGSSLIILGSVLQILGIVI